MIDDKNEIANTFGPIFYEYCQKTRNFCQKANYSFHKVNLSEVEMAIEKYRSNPTINVINEKMENYVTRLSAPTSFCWKK